MPWVDEIVKIPLADYLVGKDTSKLEPCSISAYTNADVKKLAQKIKTLTAENDKLRDLVLEISLNNINSETALKISEISQAQIEHRKIDIARVAHALTEEMLANPGNYDEIQASLNKVILADPTKPLGPQIGFDPDSI